MIFLSGFELYSRWVPLKLTFSRISARKKALENSRSPFYGKNPLKMVNYTFFWMF